MSPKSLLIVALFVLSFSTTLKAANGGQGGHVGNGGHGGVAVEMVGMEGTLNEF